MRDHTYKPFFIISAELSSLSANANEIRTSDLKEYLDALGHDYAQIIGCYKGVKEVSFMVFTSDKGLAVELAGMYHQDSVLIRNGHNDCFLWYSEDKEEFSGHFKQVDEEYAIGQDAYSICAGTYWIVSNEK